MAGSWEVNYERIVATQLEESSAVKLKLVAQAPVIVQVAHIWAETIRRGGKILFCGNGGSAADCQHLAGELVGRFQKERDAYHGIALTTDTSILTAVANDYGYTEVFARQVTAYGRAGDVLVGISTSGESQNVIRAVERARELDMISVAFTGSNGRLKELVDYVVSAASTSTPRIQEAHITMGHIICGLVEELVAGEVSSSVGLTRGLA